VLSHDSWVHAVRGAAARGHNRGKQPVASRAVTVDARVVARRLPKALWLAHASMPEDRKVVGSSRPGQTDLSCPLWQVKNSNLRRLSRWIYRPAYAEGSPAVSRLTDELRRDFAAGPRRRPASFEYTRTVGHRRSVTAALRPRPEQATLGGSEIVRATADVVVRSILRTPDAPVLVSAGVSVVSRLDAGRKVSACAGVTATPGCPRPRRRRGWRERCPRRPRAQLCLVGRTPG
jgi:hypothetical protein